MRYFEPMLVRRDRAHDHGLHAPEERGKGNAEAKQEEGRQKRRVLDRRRSGQNSLVKTPKGGIPTDRHHTQREPPPDEGFPRMRPLILSISCVRCIWDAWPTVKKMADFVRLWTSMCRSAPNVATGPPSPKAKVAMPMCSMEE